jgi:hypothetical protein
MSMSGSFLPSLGRQQPQSTRVEGADIVMKSSGFSNESQDNRQCQTQLCFNLRRHGLLSIRFVRFMFAVGTPSMAQTQSSIEHPKVAIDVVELEGTLLPKPVQEHLVTSLTQREWEEN